jgi:site-specific DNA-methyltransferase (adenine-specific)
MVWVKSAPCGFLNAKKMPMKKHEMVYVFYRKLPLYDISSHKHKFLKDTTVLREDEESLYGKETGKVFIYDKDGKLRNSEPRYDPPLPTTVLRETDDEECYSGDITYNYKDRDGPMYDPPLPHSVLEIKSEKGMHPTQKPTALIEWCLNYYSKDGDTVLDPTAGSGSTAIACINLNRKFVCIEKDPEIFKGMTERIQERLK